GRPAARRPLGRPDHRVHLRLAWRRPALLRVGEQPRLPVAAGRADDDDVRDDPGYLAGRSGLWVCRSAGPLRLMPFRRTAWARLRHDPVTLVALGVLAIIAVTS